MKTATLILCLSLIVGIARVPFAFAASVEAAQAAKERSYNEYYKAISSSSAAFANRARLRSEILAPAQDSFIRASDERLQQTLDKNGVRRGNSEQVAKLMRGERVDLNVSGSIQKQPAARVETKGNNLQNREALDGKNIPRELDFTGPAKGSSKH